MNLDLPKPPEWVTEAVCTEADDWKFFPASGRVDHAKAAKRICAGCPVVTECLTYALGFGVNLEGVWGGATRDERRRLLGKKAS